MPPNDFFGSQVKRGETLTEEEIKTVEHHVKKAD